MNSNDRLPALAVALLSGLLAASCSCSDDVPAPKPGKTETTAPVAAEPAVSLPPRPSNLPPPPVVTVTEGTQTDGTATLKGTAFVSGRIPLRKEIVMDHVPGCKDHGPGMTENVIADDEGHLQNVICYVARGLDSQYFQPLPEEPVVLDQVGCTYEPHILLMRAGQTLVIKNTDKVRHNVNSRPERRSNQTFNQLMIRTTPDLEVVFEEQEVAIPIACDVHSWMKAFVGVVNHDFAAITGPDGSFSISGLPPGKLVLEAWHEEYGRQTFEVEFEANQTVEVDWTFLADKRKGGRLVPVPPEK